MAAKVFRGTLLLQYREWGWSENHFFTAENYTDVIPLLQAVTSARMQLSAFDVKCIRLRVSDIAVRGDVALITPENPNGGDGPTGEDVQHPDIAILQRAANVPQYNVSQWLRGIRQIRFVGPTFTPDATYLIWLSDYRIVLQTATVLRVKSKTAPVGEMITVPITDVITVGAREHKTGRPFGQPLGRRKKKVLP